MTNRMVQRQSNAYSANNMADDEWQGFRVSACRQDCSEIVNKIK